MRKIKGQLRQKSWDFKHFYTFLYTFIYDETSLLSDNKLKNFKGFIVYFIRTFERNHYYAKTFICYWRYSFVLLKFKKNNNCM